MKSPITSRIFCIIVSTLFLSACNNTVSYYDAVSYKNLTDLKGEMKVLFDECSTSAAAGKDTLNMIKGFKVSSARAYEYEKGKKLNDDTIAQLEILDRTVNDVLQRYKKNRVTDSGKCQARESGSDEDTGCLTVGYCIAKWKVLESAFDIAIETERLKIVEIQSN